MSDPFLTELATECQNALNENPVLGDLGTLDAIILRNAQKRQLAYHSCMSALEDTLDHDPRLICLKEALDAAFPGLVSEICSTWATRPSTVRAIRRVSMDPYRSAALSLWMDGLNRGLDWIRRGADPAILDFSLAPELLGRDLEIEHTPVRVLSCGIGLVPACRLADSRMMAKRLDQCLPGMPGDEYPDLDEPGLDRLCRHLDDAISLVRAIDPMGYDRLVACIHTLHVGLRRDPLCSFSSSNELPGSSFVVLSLQRLEENNTAATAAQLLHEVGHVMLGLYVSSAETPLPTEPAYMSPYKNDLQALESVLHMAYTIPWECAVRMAVLDRHASPAKRIRETAFIIAYASRQIPLIDIARMGVAKFSAGISRDFPDLAAIPEWSARILALTDQLLAHDSPTRQAAHGKEREAVIARQAWDTGQMCLRGTAPLDPRIRWVSIADDGQSLKLDYDGSVHHVVYDNYRATGKNYGAYVDAADEVSALERGMAR